MTATHKSFASLYQTIWRWHFYAGLLVLPFLVMMAITGGLYLFKPELDHWMYRSVQDVPARQGATLSLDKVIEEVESTQQGRVLQLTPSTTPTQAVRLLVRVSNGEVRTVFANPYDGNVTGSTAYGGIMQTLRKIHSLQKFGFWASSLIEITAGWTIVLVGTGIFLWWPRNKKLQGVLIIRRGRTSRVFWRDLHAVTGAFACAVILFLAVTGMPWSMFWGNHVQDWATQAHLNQPTPPAAVTPVWLMAATMPEMSHQAHSQDVVHESMPWAMEKMESPSSTPIPTMTHAMPISVDQAMQRFAQLHVNPAADIALPEEPSGAYVATWQPDRVQDTRVVYLDQYSGKVLDDVGFAQWGPVAKAIQWGIAVHQGQQYGAINRYLMLAGCIAVVLMAIAAVIMWWKRRPTGSLGAPPAVDGFIVKGFLSIMIVTGVVFPLVGMSMIFFVCISWLLNRLNRYKQVLHRSH